MEKAGVEEGACTAPSDRYRESLSYIGLWKKKEREREREREREKKRISIRGIMSTH